MKEFPRKLRINTQLQRELAELIVENLTDPRLDGVSITEVDVSPDLRNATVHVSSLKSDAELEQSVRALAGAGAILRKGLGRRLRLRYVPQLHFRSDSRIRKADRLTQLIRDAVVDDHQHARERGEE
ncbi:30S ribosome-binding factor RbfA [Panacagrimonas sp.]|uniref:30S ribosome-binding factor RbfA n=1 Tax=Panacagrimonas sp. TaxID=2480088 RepID=UPI003B524FBE